MENTNAKLFQYAVIWNPNKKEEKEGEKAKLVVEVTTVLAKDDKTAMMMAIKAIPKNYEDKYDQLDIAMRPF